MELESKCHKSPMIELVRHLPLVCLVNTLVICYLDLINDRLRL